MRQAELTQARSQIERLEEQNQVYKEDNVSQQTRISQLSLETEQQAQEMANLRSRTGLSQQNWAKERDNLLSREAHTREEFDAAKQAMQDWEVLAMEERSVREGLGDRVAELEEQLVNQREAYERAASERDGQSTTVDGLQRALQEIHGGKWPPTSPILLNSVLQFSLARKQERRDLVETSQAQMEELRKQLKTADQSSSSAQSELEFARKELERTSPFEKEVKEKNLQIGKLRHEAVILNEHLTKALRFLKKGKPEDNVDRYVSNRMCMCYSLTFYSDNSLQITFCISLHSNDLIRRSSKFFSLYRLCSAGLKV